MPGPGDLAPRIRPTPELPADFDAEDAAVTAIDQVVVDGEVDGLNRRVPFSVLIAIGFQGLHGSDGQFTDFREALVEDERFIDIIRKKYSYEPVLSEGSEVTASPYAIVNGQGMYTEEERVALMGLMDSYADAVYAQGGGPEETVASIREVSGRLHSAGLVLDKAHFRAFREYMRIGPRLFLGEDGRVLLADHVEGGADGPLPAMPRIHDFSAVIAEALPHIHTDHEGAFSRGALLGTLKALGVGIRPDQEQQIFRETLKHPAVGQSEGNGHFQIVGDIAAVSDERAREAEREAASRIPLEKKMRLAFAGNPTRRKRHTRRGAGGKRAVDMSALSLDEQY
jgi:hypothetical protein